MSTRAFEAFTRHAAAAVSRRTSLTALGATAVVAALAAPRSAPAKAKAGKKAKKRCQKQVGACRAALVDVCDGSAYCEEVLLPCCPKLKTCNAPAFIDCVWTAL
jgi:hypothetical protein